MTTTALMLGGATLAAAQGGDEPTAATVEEEISQLRGMLAAQAQRLDQAEANLQRQQKLIGLQEQKIARLETDLLTARSIADTATANLAELTGTGWYTASATGVHVVKPGDTLYSIAKAMGVSVNVLAQNNNIAKAHEIEVGQVIKRPGASARVAVATPATQSPKQKIKNPPAAEPQLKKPQRVAVNTKQTPPGPQEDPNIQDRAIAQQRRREESKSELPTEVGARPDEENESPYLALFSDVAGILTPKGSLFVEPSVSFTASSDNRFFFEGVEIIDAILIGAIEATDTDRLAITENFGVRYGLTNRLEIDASLPYVYREDRISGVAIDDRTEVDDAKFGSGIGDAGVGLHYQLNKGTKWPYLVANVRAKAPTGTGPFDVERAPNGEETELSTGSGYWSIEPSLSFVMPSDPAVVFGSIGYQKNLSASPNEQVGSSIIREFKPGDAVSASLGVGLSLNERLSVNFGYSHRYFMRTETFTETLDDFGNPILLRSRQSPATVGNYLFGGSYSINDRVRLNLGTSFGATDEAPDFRTSLRLQVKLKD